MTIEEVRTNRTEILDNLNTAVLLIDHELRLRFINQAAESLLELSSRRSLGERITHLLPGSEPMAPILFDALQTSQQYTQRRAELRTVSGVRITVDCSITPVSEDQWPRLLIELHRLDRYLKIDRDATLQEHQEISRHMIRGLAHEIKNPLGGIRGSAQLLKAELPGPELREYTDIIIEETDRLNSLVDRLLGPRTVPEFTPSNIHEVLERACRLTALEAGPGIEIVRDYDPSIPEISLDPEMMLQAVLNITRNAVQSMKEQNRPKITLVTRIERQITIAAVRHKNVLRVDIEDNGSGIPESLHEHLFFPMISGRSDGTGLGLSVAHSIVHQHQGMIDFSSEPGLTRFTIMIPLERATS